MKLTYILAVLLILLGTSSSWLTAQKVLIFTCVHSRPDFIELHVKTFKAFLKDPDYEFVVFNDASNENMKATIEQTCNRLGIQCIRVPQNLHSSHEATFRHNDSMNYAFSSLAFDFNGLVVMVDADMFLIKPFSVEEYMNGYDLIGGQQTRNNGTLVTYIAPTLVFFNMNTLPNKRTIHFAPGHILGNHCDNGAYTYYYLKDNPSLKYRLFLAKSIDHYLPNDRTQLQALGYDEILIQLKLSLTKVYGFELHGDNSFLHYYAGGCNWPGYSAAYLQEKNNVLNRFIDNSINFYNRVIH